MDPVLILFIFTAAALAGGAARAARNARRTRRRRTLRASVTRALPAPGRDASLFDLFWDLGASDFALTLMAHHGLLPASAARDRRRRGPHARARRRVRLLPLARR